MGFRGGMQQETLRAPFFVYEGPAVTGPGFAGCLIASSADTAVRAPVTVIVPPGTPASRRRPESREEAMRAAQSLVPRYAFEQTGVAVPDGHTDRTLIGDARDLFVNVVFKATGVELPSHPWDHPGLLDVAPGPEETAGGTTAIFAGPVFIHLGENPITTVLLQSRQRDINPRLVAAAEREGPFLGFHLVFDADGFALVRVFDGGSLHIMVLGGSDYGTYYGVATLLRETLGVRWIFPGDLGEVIPTRGTYLVMFGEVIDSRLIYDRTLNRYHEPDYRGRAMDLLSATMQFSAPEVDAVRTWALNNRLHPADERTYLRQIFLGSAACREPLPLVWTALGKESRISSDHALHLLLSPHDDDRQQDGLNALRVGESHPEFFPDVRPRYSLGAGYDVAYVGADLPVPGTPRFLGAPIATAWGAPRYAQDPAMCSRVSPMMSWWRGAGGTSEAPRRLGEFSFVRDQVAPAVAAAAVPAGGQYLSVYLAAGSEVFAYVSLRRRLFRALPRCYRSRRTRLDEPFEIGWKPCVYGAAAELRAGEVPVVNSALSLHLAGSLAPALSFLREMSLRREATGSVAPNDGQQGWCFCDACSMSSTSSSQGSFGGGNLRPGEEVQQLRLNAGLPLFFDRSNDVNMPSRHPTGFDAYYTRVWFTPGDLHPTRDEATARGYFMSFCCPDEFSRRVADLTRSVAAWMGSRADDVYVTTHAYQRWRGAPMSDDIQTHLREQRVADDRPFYLGPRVVPFVTSTADVAEYGLDASIPLFAPSQSPSVLHYYYPRQFNEMRWSVFARQYGIYEYMYGAFVYMVPRLYSTQLRRALQRAHRRRARAFNAETTPIWGTEGPKWFEVAEMLWRLESSEGLPSGVPDDPTPRRVWAERVLSDESFGVVPVAMVDELIAIYDEIERRWTEAVRLAEGRNRRRVMDEIYQPSLVNITNAVNEPWQLDAFDGTSSSVFDFLGDLDAPCDLFARMLDLQAWFDRGFPGSVQRARERLALLVAGMAPVAALARASRAVRFAHRLVEPPPQLTQGWGAGGPLLPVPGQELYAPMQQAFQRIYGWVIDPPSYTRAIHLALQDALIAGGLITRVPSRRTWQQLSIPPSLTTTALGTAWLKVDSAALQGYVAAWNAVTRFDQFKGTAFNQASGGAIVSMLRSIRTWVLEFAGSISGNGQPEFERYSRSSGDFQRSLDNFRDQA